MKKIKNFFAILISVILLSCYIASFVLSLMNFEGATDWLKVSIYLSVILPVLFYAFLLVYRYLDGSKK